MLTERQLNYRVSELSIEENYTNLDIEEYERDLTNVNKNVGYTFRYPQRWLESPSQNKVVGIRRLDIIPTSHVISLKCVIKDGTENPPETIVNIQIMYHNTLLKIITYLINSLNNAFTNDPSFEYIYKEKGKLMIKCDYEFKFVDPINGAYDTNIDNFLILLNQDTTNDNYSILNNLSNGKSFTNVWDREYLEFHASFSDSKRRFIGIKGDFYEKPTVIYNAPSDGSTFNIKFTSDG